MKNILITILKNTLVHDFHIRVKRQVLSCSIPAATWAKSKMTIMNEARATASAEAKVSEDLSIQDAEILRLIEERRSTPKEEKQRLKEVSKCINNCIRDKKE